jgi:Icc-related predicted phosphoesterase
VEEKQMQLWLADMMEPARESRHLIFMTHTPPFQTNVDKVSSGVSVGSPAVRKFIEDVQPELCITGHIHEARSVDFIGRTKVINPGNFGAGGYVKIVFDGEKLDAELLQA